MVEEERRLPANIIVYDGACKLCHWFVNLVLAHDKDQCFYFCSAQSKLGSELMQQAGYQSTGDALNDYQSVLLVQDIGSDCTAISQKSQAFFRIMAKLGAPLSWFGVFRLFPSVLRDWVYDRVAKNRYRLFGQYAVCRLPVVNNEHRFIS